MKYAIVENGGKQYKAVEGETIEVDRLPDEVGDKIELDRVLMVVDDEKFTVGTPEVGGVKVSATVAAHFKGKKVIVFKYHPKKRYRLKKGHRQQYTRLEINAIGKAAVIKAAKAEATPVKEEKVEPKTAEPVAVKKPAAKKPAAKESAAKKPVAKKTAAKKPAAKKPAIKESATKKPVAKKPAAKKPAAKKPAAKKPAAKKPAEKKPAAKKPAKTAKKN